MVRSNAALKVVEEAPVTVGSMIDRMETIRQERKPLDDKSKKLKAEYDLLAEEIMKRLDADCSLKASSRTASVSISETPVPVIKDVSKLVPYLVKNKLWHLFLQQPLTTPAWREAVGKKGSDLPGTETFIKRGLNHSSLKV